MVKKSEQPPEQTTGDLEQEWAENIESFEEALVLSRDVFKSILKQGLDLPSFEQVDGVLSILDSGVQRNLIAPLMAEAIEKARQILVGVTEIETSFVLDLFGILLDDEKAEEHLISSMEIAKKLGGFSHWTVVEVYFKIFGGEESFEV